MSPVSTNAASQPISRAAVDSVLAYLPTWLDHVRRTHRQPGLQVAVWHDGELVLEHAGGTADQQTGQALGPGHRFRIASHSKTFTAVAVLRLVDQGTLRLDDRIGDHLPEFAGKPAFDLTLRDLLSHSAGLTRDTLDARWWTLDAPYPDRDRLRADASGDLAAAPRAHMQYSNIGFGLIGLVLEAATGKGYAEAMRDLVLDPLGIDALGPDVAAGASGPPGPEDEHGFARGHSALAYADERVVVESPHTDALAPATGFWATAGGIAEAFGRLLCDAELLSAASHRALLHPIWETRPGERYSLGLQHATRHGFHLIGHSGGFPGMLTRTWAAPESRLVVSILGNAADAPSAALAEGLLGLFALASGRPAPEAERVESPDPGAAGSGRPRPGPLGDQEDALGATARELADQVSGRYANLWGLSDLVVLGDRLFVLDPVQNPAQGAVELEVAGTQPDPVTGSVDPECVRLATWGADAYGPYAEPMLARVDLSRCHGILRTGNLLVPAEVFSLPQRLVRPL